MVFLLSSILYTVRQIHLREGVNFMKKVFLLFFVLLLFGMIGSVSCNDSDAQIAECYAEGGQIFPGDGYDDDPFDPDLPARCVPARD